jgi:RimJ/RimL family protein N-acetyltransferase
VPGNGYSIRQLHDEDLGPYRSMRVEALTLEKGMYGSPPEKEIAYNDEEWINRLTSPASAIFGLFHDGNIIGITAIFIQDADEGIGYMTQSYIKKKFRGQHLSRLFYEARIGWARERKLKKLVISHRQKNEISKAANQRYGFKYTHTEMRQWPDGMEEANLFYELALS